MTAAPVAEDGLGDLVPVHVTMGRLAATVRATVTVFAAVAAVLGAQSPVSYRWLLPMLCAFVGWTVVYVRIAWTHGVRPWLSGVDLTLACVLALALGKLVPEAALPRGTSWVAVAVSMMIIWAQPAGPIWTWVPAGLAVAASFVVGSQLAHVPDGGVMHGITLGTQAVAGAVVMQIAIRTGHEASRTFASLRVAQTEAEITAARQADELAQLCLLHNGPLTTLTMAIHSDCAHPSSLLRRRAAANLDALPRLAQFRSTSDGPVRLDERLAQIVVWYEAELHISTTLRPSLVTAEAADAFVDAVSACLENVVRHAEVDRAALDVGEQDGTIRVTVADGGRGFDPDALPDHRFGVRQSVIGRMRTAGGSARIRSAPGQGTTIELEWRDG